MVTGSSKEEEKDQNKRIRNFKEETIVLNRSGQGGLLPEGDYLSQDSKKEMKNAW